MSKKNKKIFLFLGFFLSFFLSADFASALEVTYPEILGNSINNTSDLAEYACYIFAVGISLTISVAAISIAIGGIKYLVDFGRGKFTSDAKDMIRSGLFGLVIIICTSLILHTINPTLSQCKITGLPSVEISSSYNPFSGYFNIDVSNYREIPLGVLTENLLTRTTDCYGFDQLGNPVNGDKLSESGSEIIYGPTYINHDRADCVTQLTDGAQKKAQAIATLAEEISKLMQKCDCKNKCDPVCNPGVGYNNKNPIAQNTESYIKLATASINKTVSINQQPVILTTSLNSNTTVLAQAIPNNMTAADQAAWNKITAADQAAWNKITAADQAAWNKITAADQAAWNKITAANQAVWDNSRAADQAAWDRSNAADKAIWDNSRAADQAVWDNSRAANQAVWDNSRAANQAVWDNSRAANQAVWDNSRAANQAVWDNSRAADQAVWDNSRAADQAAWDRSRAADQAAWDRSRAADQAVWDRSNAADKALWDRSRAADQAVWDRSRAADKALWDRSRAADQAVWDRSRAADQAVWDRSRAADKALWDRSRAADQAVWDRSRAADQAVWDGLGPSYQDARDDIESLYEDAWDDIESSYEDAWDDIESPNQGNPGCKPTYCGPGGSCVGACVGGACQQPAGTTDCCPVGVKNQIEHGPIQISIDLNTNTSSCQTEYVELKGLDEFRCPNPNGNYSPCSNISSYVEEPIQVNGKTYFIINQKRWKNLNLWQQLNYFTEKLEVIKQEIKKDEDVLDKARGKLASCYLAVPSISLLKTFQNTEQEKKVIITHEDYQDPQTNKYIDASKYCQGFNYNNSSCLKKCNDMCPDTSQELIAEYEKCKKDDPACIERAYFSRSCKYSKDNPSQKFSECISSCQSDCTTNCQKKYITCSEEYTLCESNCNNNSQCVLGNTDSCLFDAKSFGYCARNLDINDAGNIEYCINNSYYCKNGSNHYAGYPDCVKPSDCSSKKDRATCENDMDCLWGENGCYQKYSASYLFDSFLNWYPGEEKCPYPYKPAPSGSSCYSSKKPSATCSEVCPETQKCLASSTCAYCSCDNITDPNNNTLPLKINFTVPNQSTSGINAGNAGYTTQEEPILEYQMVGSQCNKYAYNDDPLNFYCEDEWWNNPLREAQNKLPVGKDLICSRSGEVPVGQTVDNARKWADELMADIDKTKTNIQAILDQTKKIGTAKDTNPIQDYCMCGAKKENNQPICKTNCQYTYWTVCSPYGCWYDCNCSLIPCQGSPCQQMVDYLSDLWNQYRQFKKDFIEFYTKMIKEPRSDIMKELTYSREATNTCSTVMGNYDYEQKLYNCSRVNDEIISPASDGKVNYYGKDANVGCYGVALGQRVKKDLTDNWFCCQNFSKTSTTASKADTGADTGNPNTASGTDEDQLARCLEENDGNEEKCQE
jgi:hypothetical protein